jgi:hypothetical protein
MIEKNGDPGGARTRDPLIKSQMLYQLSYRIVLRGGALLIQISTLPTGLNAPGPLL